MTDRGGGDIAGELTAIPIDGRGVNGVIVLPNRHLTILTDVRKQHGSDQARTSKDMVPHQTQILWLNDELSNQLFQPEINYFNVNP